MKTAWGVTSAVAALWMLGGIASGRDPSSTAGAKPVQVLQGEIVELKVSGKGLSAIEGLMGGEAIHFYPSEDGTYAALVGVDLEARPGLARVIVKGMTHGGTPRETQIVLKIKAKAFHKESFSIPAEFDQLRPEVLERIRNEQEQFARAFMSSKPQRLWAGPFVSPVSGDITSPFGYRRVINGTPRAPHGGVDLKSALGTEVLAANQGRAVLVGDFFFSGKSLVLDHGGGLYTLYFHLSEFKVDEGAKVRKGDVIGLSGMTGRVTGPHLHWGARLNGARVDPFELIEKLGGKSAKAPRAEAAGENAER